MRSPGLDCFSRGFRPPLIPCPRPYGVLAFADDNELV